MDKSNSKLPISSLPWTKVIRNYQVKASLYSTKFANDKIETINCSQEGSLFLSSLSPPFLQIGENSRSASNQAWRHQTFCSVSETTFTWELTKPPSTIATSLVSLPRIQLRGTVLFTDPTLPWAATRFFFKPQNFSFFYCSS